MHSTHLERAAPAVRSPDGFARSLLFSCLLAAGAFAEPSPPAAALPPPPAVESALPLNPALAGNAAALSLLAQHLELTDDPRAVELRQAAVTAEPEQLEHRFALVHTALRFGRLPVAQRTLDDLVAFAPPSSSRAFAEAAVAAASGYYQAATDTLNAALTGREGDELLGLEKAFIDLRHGTTAGMKNARTELKVMLAGRPADARVRRELILDALRQHEPDMARRLSDAAIGVPFRDLLLRAELNLPTPATAETFATLAAKLGPRAAQSPEDAALWVEWLLAHEQTPAALAWIATLPPALQSAPALLTAQADSHAALHQWDRALPLIQAGAWGAVPPELAAHAAAARAQASAPARAAAWAAVLRSAGSQLPALQVLHRLAVNWDLPAEREAVLIAVTQRQPIEAWAFQALADIYRNEKATGKLESLYALWHTADPRNIAIESQHILLSVLTTRKISPELRGTIDDRRMFNPDQPLLGVAHALTLWQVGRADEALATTENFPAAARHRANLAFYHGLFVAATGGRQDEAQAYLALADKASLLPEEQSLIQTARTTLEKAAAR